MNYKIIIKPAAELEIIEAYEWYASKNEKLGYDLLNELDDSIERISPNPYQFKKRYRLVSIIFTKRFPYDIHYTIEANQVYIHAFFHTSRKPKS